MNKLAPEETALEGKWLFHGKEVSAEEICKRIEWLISEVLEELGSDDSGWERLYRDPDDERFWVHYYPNSRMHGSGPPSLRLISESEAKVKFNV